VTRAEVDQWADDAGVELLLADGFDDAILGVGQRFNSYFVVYDVHKVLDTMVTQHGMTEEDAREFFEVNTVGAWVGEGTPCFLTLRVEP
jgi:hypothetical protein